MIEGAIKPEAILSITSITSISFHLYWFNSSTSEIYRKKIDDQNGIETIRSDLSQVSALSSFDLELQGLFT